MPCPDPDPNDTVPYEQAENMRDALLLRDSSADITQYTMNGGLHSFNYWHKINMESIVHECVSEEVIDFLNAHKNDP